MHIYMYMYYVLYLPLVYAFVRRELYGNENEMCRQPLYVVWENEKEYSR